jgi:hypothetical protein
MFKTYAPKIITKERFPEFFLLVHWLDLVEKWFKELQKTTMNRHRYQWDQFTEGRQYKKSPEQDPVELEVLAQEIKSITFKPQWM